MSNRQWLWKFLSWALVLTLVCCIAIGLWTGAFLFIAKYHMTLPQEVEMMTPDHQGHSTVVRAIASDDQVLKRKIDRLPNRNMTANVGQYPSEELATKDLTLLRAYIDACDDDFCQGLEKQISIQKINWPGGVTYHITIERIDEPTFYALCNYMWNGYPERWARGTYHVCSDFNHKEDP